MPRYLARPLFLFRLLLITLAAVLAPIGASTAAAAASTTASGEFTTLPVATFSNIRELGGGVTIVDLTAHVRYTGMFTGTSIVRGFIVFLPDGSAFFHDTEISSRGR